ncbi:hypothetical protein [Thiobacter aerophilum]|uniref:Uncharacterized protein n=1 Tax=Thiobacter aerophilum TaxID=3121275 RepID=A0ABV0EG94_9BURK
MDNQRVEQVVTHICELGCTRVREIMGALAAQEAVPETAELGAEERAAVLAELRSIMAVYDART